MNESLYNIILENTSDLYQSLGYSLVNENSVLNQDKYIMNYNVLVESISNAIDNSDNIHSVVECINNTFLYEANSKNYKDIPIIECVNAIFEELDNSISLTDEQRMNKSQFRSELAGTLTNSINDVQEDGFNPNPYNIYNECPIDGTSRNVARGLIKLDRATTDEDICEALLNLGRLNNVIERSYYVSESNVVTKKAREVSRKTNEVTGHKSKNTLPPMYYLSKVNMDGRIVSPSIPFNFFTQQGFGDNTTKRVSFTPSIDKCLIGLSKDLIGLSKDLTGHQFYVHIPENVKKENVIYPTNKQVPDVSVTNEIWVTTNVKLKCIGIIKVRNAIKPGVPYTYVINNEYLAKLYNWKWEWVIRTGTDHTTITENAVKALTKLNHTTTYTDLYETLPNSDKLNNVIEGSYYVSESNVVTKKAREVSRKTNEVTAKAINKVGGTAKELGDAGKHAVTPMEKFINDTMDKIKKADSNERRNMIIKGGAVPKVWRWLKRGIALYIGGTVGAAFPPAAMAAGIAFIGWIATDKYLDGKERNRILKELEDEIEIVNEKIDDSRGDENKQKKYELMRIRNDLKRTHDKIRLGLKY